MAVAAISMPRTILANTPAAKIVALQLYSVRDEMKADPLGTLKQVAAMGYVYLEHASYVDRKFYGYSASEFKKILSDLGLKMISGHTVFGMQHWDDKNNTFTKEWMDTIEDAAILEQEFVISPWMDENMRNSHDALKKYLDIFNECGALCLRARMKFGYHNHDFEFMQEYNGQKIFDIMMEKIDPKMVVIQLDIGNIVNGGANAFDVIKKYPGRFENIHVKDEIKVPGNESAYESCLLGQGVIRCQEIVDLATKIGGTNCYIIEQESYQGKKPLDCARENLSTMKEWGY